MTENKTQKRGGRVPPSTEDLENDMVAMTSGSPATKAALNLSNADQIKSLDIKVEDLKKKQAVQKAEFNAYTEELQAGWNAKNKTFQEANAEIEKQITQVEGALRYLNGEL